MGTPKEICLVTVGYRLVDVEMCQHQYSAEFIMNKYSDTQWKVNLKIDGVVNTLFYIFKKFLPFDWVVFWVKGGLTRASCKYL